MCRRCRTLRDLAAVPFRHHLAHRQRRATPVAAHGGGHSVHPVGTWFGSRARSLAGATCRLARWSDSADFHYAHGSALRAYATGLDPEHDDLAGQLILASHVPWQRAAELTDRPEYTGTLTTRASVLAAQGLAEDFEAMGRADDAARYRALALALVAS